MMTVNDRLHATVAAVCPIVGASIGTAGVSATVLVSFTPAATAPQRIAAQNAVNSFDWSSAAQAAWENAQQPERTAVLSSATQAVTDNNTYVALANPTNAQTVAQVKRLSNQNTTIIKRLAQIG